MYGGYGNTNLAGNEVPSGYDEINPDEPVRLPGRPSEKPSFINTEKDPLGPDRTGRDSYNMEKKTGEDKLKVKYQGNSPLSINENATAKAQYYKNKAALEQFGKRKVDLYKESSLLNEEQIKPDLL